MVMGTKPRRRQPACWHLAAVLLVVLSRAPAASSAASTSVATEQRVQPIKGKNAEPDPAAKAPDLPAAPKPAPTSRNDLAAAFVKATPVTIADLKAMEQQVESLVTRVSPAVVAVELGLTSGSGVVISADGLVLTAGHVCGQPNRDVRFTFADGRTASGKTLGVNRDSDTGLMKITDTGSWPHAPMGELEQARIGDWVLALGHPGGFDARRSLVTRLGRIIRLTPEAMQTDCTISPGDSGGPLIDMFGRVIGIHSAISSSMAENYHVPVTAFYLTWDQLASGQSGSSLVDHPRAYLGATASDDPSGCRISRVEVNGPAFKAGLRPGDLVLRIEEREIKVGASFRRWVAEAKPGEHLRLEIKRGNKLLPLDVKLQAPPASR
jgi:serine protease Do